MKKEKDINELKEDKDYRRKPFFPIHECKKKKDKSMFIYKN